MTLHYRGIWQDDRPDLVDAASAQFYGWLGTKGIHVEPLEIGVTDGNYDQGTFEVTAHRTSVGGTDAVQLELVEDRPGEGERWVTQLTVIEGPTGDHWVWVDLDRVADDVSEGPEWAAPRLARELVDSGADVRVDQVRLTSSAHPIAATGLAGLIRNEGRTLPIVVFSQDPVGGMAATQRRADVAARAMVGAVQTMILTTGEMATFADLIGEDLAVAEGNVRVYLPNSGPTGLRPGRHRTISRSQIAGRWDRAARILALMITSIATSRRPPAAYDHVRRELRIGQGEGEAVLLEVAESEIARLSAGRDQLQVELELLKEELLDIQVELDDETARAERLSNQFQISFIAEAEPSALDSTTDLAVEPESIEEALATARRLLTDVVIPEGVERDIDDLDSQVNSRSWGLLTWSGLRALHLYAGAQFDGNFKQWCLDSGHRWAWPASDKKLAMRESESVEQNARRAEQRNLPVSTDIDPSGRAIMWTHLKIAEGGGPQAPRIYFYDDTRGPTGKVHIGFVGPHRYMENTRTN